MKQIKIYVLREIRASLIYGSHRYIERLEVFIASTVACGIWTKSEGKMISDFLVNVFDCPCILTDKMTCQEAIERLTNIVDEL